MIDKIERFSKGDFEYERPFLTLSMEEIVLTVEAGKSLTGSFTIANSFGIPMQGVVYASGRCMQLEHESFEGEVIPVNFIFYANSLRAGDEVKGEFHIVSDIGEQSLGFTVQVEAPYCMSSMGKIKDLFQFTNLAMSDWTDAKRVFRSEEFETILLASEERYRTVYHQLVRGMSTSQALEEFLVTIHKKSEITLEVDRVQCDYQLQKEEPLTDRLILTKNQWGYAKIRVNTDSDFIQLDQKFIWTDDFVENSHLLLYMINPEYLKAGNNTGHIFIRTAHQTITVTIECKYKKNERGISLERQNQKVDGGLLDTYLGFRLNKIDLEDYLDETEKMITKLPGPEVSYLKDLLRTHLAIISGKTKLAEELLADFKKDEAVLKRKSVMEYCAYLYLDALFYKDEEKTKVASETILGYYVEDHFDWRILWFLLYTDKNFDKNKGTKLEYIKEQYLNGCRSPILYYEGVCIFNEEPYLLRELTEFEIQVLNYGIKNWILSKEAAKQFTYLANKLKQFHPVIFRGLVKLYDEYSGKDILSAICSMLIKGMKRSEKYFEWYRLGVEEQLRITELYEYYMYTINSSGQDSISQQVLLYFIYNNSLSDSKKAFLFAHVVKNKENNEPIYRSYYKKMEIFTLIMLERHMISSDLAILYREFLHNSEQEDQVWKNLSYVLFRQELECMDSGIVSVIVLQKEIDSVEIIPLVNQKALINKVSENTELIFVDGFGDRYSDTVPYRLTPMLDSSEFVNTCFSHSDHSLLLLHMFDRYQKNRVLSPESRELMEKVLLLEGLQKEYEAICYQMLVEYYYDHYNGEWLDYFLDLIELPFVRHGERSGYLELMIVRGFYEKALYNIEWFGLDGISINRLVKLCAGCMKIYGIETKHDYLVKLCYHVFGEGKYDEGILRYLVTFFNGSTQSMYKLWQAAVSFDLSCHDLEKRLLTQILFTESYVGEGYQIFHSYYSGVSNPMLIRAYLSYYAYQYLVHNQIIDGKLFSIMKRELGYEANDICLLAWLKYYSNQTELSEPDKDFAEYHINMLTRRGIVLPFILYFRDRVTLPDDILDDYIISYHSNPKKQVTIHYCLQKSKGDQYISEPMTNTFMGIYTKRFLLFYHETLQYYITEESEEEEEELVESLNLQYECENPGDNDSNYDQINLMLMALEMKEDNTLLEMMYSYSKREFLISECFTPIEDELSR